MQNTRPMKAVNYLKLLTVAIIIIISSCRTASSQVLISLIFGDKLNSGGIEFGLDGGINFSNMSNTEGNMAPNWNLGFFFYPL